MNPGQARHPHDVCGPSIRNSMKPSASKPRRSSFASTEQSARQGTVLINEVIRLDGAIRLAPK